MRKSVCVGMCAAALLCGAAVSGKEIKPVVKTSFAKVTEKLDKNGTLFNYFSSESGIKATKKIYKSISGSVLQDNKDNPYLPKIFTLIENLAAGSGYAAIDGYGQSAIQINKNFYRNRSFISHSKNPKGFIWEMFKVTKQNDFLYGLPKDTLLAASWKCNIKPLWDAVKKEIIAVKLDSISGIKTIEESARQNGFDIDKTLASLDGRYIFLLTCDPNKKISIPMPVPVTTNEPDIMLGWGINNDFIFKALKAKIPVINKKQANANIIEIPFPPVIPNWKPVIRVEGDLLFFSSNNSLIDKFLANRKTKKGLASTAGFKQLATRLSLDCDSFGYLSPRADKIIKDIILQVAKQSEAQGQINTLISAFDIPCALAVVKFRDDGILQTANSNLDISSLYSMQQSGIASGAILAGMLLPALNTARDKAQGVSCMSNMKQIGLACMMYTNDNNDQFPANLEELRTKNYLSDVKIYTCPAAKSRYIYLGNKLPAISKIKMPSKTVLLAETPANHAGLVNILFVDGHVQKLRVRAKNTKDLLPELKKLGYIVPAGSTAVSKK